uniref:DUF19 domain-containing protein n=1 Tax=Panagrolaimus sp. ES5 TaxID=591445 RepID=A0AC34FFU9_9BILA
MEGVNEICERYKILQNCLGNDVMSNCTNAAAFAKTNFSMGNSKGMISNYFIFKFQCGRGYEILETDFDCLSSFPNGCYYDLDTCNQWYDMIHCISKSAQKECSDEAGYYMFETLNIEECYIRPDCQIHAINGMI